VSRVSSSATNCCLFKVQTIVITSQCDVGRFLRSQWNHNLECLGQSRDILLLYVLWNLNSFESFPFKIKLKNKHLFKNQYTDLRCESFKATFELFVILNSLDREVLCYLFQIEDCKHLHSKLCCTFQSGEIKSVLSYYMPFDFFRVEFNDFQNATIICNRNLGSFKILAPGDTRHTAYIIIFICAWSKVESKLFFN
jgi:hypothetical protein